MAQRSLQAEHIADLLDRLALHQRSRQQGDGLNPAQWEALRFLGRANRYSRNPTALTDFLGTTKGTVSQTLIALERKRLVTREPDRRDRRSIRIELTLAGRTLLDRDPMQGIAGAAADLPPAAQQALGGALGTLLAELRRGGGQRSFGICQTCRLFCRAGASVEAGGPHRCGLTHEPLAEAEAQLICAAHEAAA
ncbi:MAG TPA: MarR family transcriptional regulator [Dongiaceae bacterium]|nr:MarR family transcriptional regulator [Dongiaceae bacterium]